MGGGGIASRERRKRKRRRCWIFWPRLRGVRHHVPRPGLYWGFPRAGGGRPGFPARDSRRAQRVMKESAICKNYFTPPPAQKPGLRRPHGTGSRHCERLCDSDLYQSRVCGRRYTIREFRKSVYAGCFGNNMDFEMASRARAERAVSTWRIGVVNRGQDRCAAAGLSHPQRLEESVRRTAVTIFRSGSGPGASGRRRRRPGT